MNQRVLITGASHGIGKAAAERFAKEGCTLILNCRQSVEELSALEFYLKKNYSVDCISLIGDVSSPDFVKEMFEKTMERFGGIDILINNAGISHIGLLGDMSNEEWHRVMGINLDSVFYCCREAIPYMLSKKSGSIVNVSSVWGNIGASMEVAYSASKGAVNSFTKALAKELAPSNIRVNALACGVIDTEMNRMLSPEDKIELADEIPSGRFGTPEEVAHLAWQIANAPSYMTGQIIGIDGGFI